VQTPEHGVVYGLSNEAYHAGPGLSLSGAKRILKSPHHYHALTQPTAPPKEPTPSMRSGTMAHCAFLEPDQFDSRYEVGPDVSKNSRVWREFQDHCASVEIEPITQLERDRAFAQAASLRTLEDIPRLMSNGHAEVSAYWVDRRTGVHCKCRPDYVAHGLGLSGECAILLDVKTTTDASPEAFARSVVTYGYHMQDDWYCEGYTAASGREVLGMLFAVVESEFPYAAALYSLDPRALQLGRKRNKRARAAYAACQRDGKWPSYPSGVIELQLPSWALKELNDQ
jgi:hypothetical protein